MAFQMAGAFNARSYQKPTNSATTAPRKPAAIVVPPGFEQVHKDLMAYNGTFGFMLDLRSKLCKYGKLSDKQWESAKKCLAPKPVADPDAILVDSCSIPIVVTATSARRIAKDVGWSMNPTTLVVTKIKNRDRRGFTATIKADWTGSVSVCRCCGKSLTDWRSQATGVGPVCVKGTGIQYVRNQQDVARFQKEMQDLCQKMGEVEVYIKGWDVKEGMMLIDSSISTSTPKTITATTAPATSGKLQNSNSIRVSSTLFQWHPEISHFTGKWDDIANHGIDPKLLDFIHMTNPATGRSALFSRLSSKAFEAVIDSRLPTLYLVMS